GWRKMPSRIAWWVKSRVASFMLGRFDTTANPTPIIGMCSHPEKKTFTSQTNVCGVSAGRSDDAHHAYRLRPRPPPLAPAALARRCAESRSAGRQKFLAGRAEDR